MLSRCFHGRRLLLCSDDIPYQATLPLLLMLVANAAPCKLFVELAMLLLLLLPCTGAAAAGAGATGSGLGRVSSSYGGCRIACAGSGPSTYHSEYLLGRCIWIGWTHQQRKQQHCFLHPALILRSSPVRSVYLGWLDTSAMEAAALRVLDLDPALIRVSCGKGARGGGGVNRHTGAQWCAAVTAVEAAAGRLLDAEPAMISLSGCLYCNMGRKLSCSAVTVLGAP
jgi:hypothetical protein